MSRFRTTAVAALAVSAVLLTSSAAYAHDHGLIGNSRKLEAKVSPASSMSWAYYRGELTDFSTATPGVFDGARATARMIGLEGSSYFTLQIRGIGKSAAGKVYPAHLHEGPCVVDNGPAALGHYNAQKEEGALTPVANAETEVWLNFKVSSGKTARITVTVPFVPKSGERSIVIHSDQPPVAPATSPARLACLPLEIKKFPST